MNSNSSTRSRLFASDVHHKLLIVGLLMVIVSNTFDATVLKVTLDEALANLGVLLLTIGGVQWLFEAHMREQLCQEIASLTIRNIRVATSGLSDVLESSKDVDYSEEIKTSRTLLIGLNYSPRILEDYIEEFRERGTTGLKTIAIVLRQGTEAAQYLSSTNEESAHIEPNLRKLKSIVHELNANYAGKIELLEHSAVLRYSFVSSDSSIWIKPYRNSAGRSKVPALQLKSGSTLHSYFKQDIDALMQQATT